jgi:hypothetical protein
MTKTNNEEGDTQYQGPLTLLERQIIATKTQIALDHEVKTTTTFQLNT